MSPRQSKALRIVLYAAACLSFVFALFVWVNIDADLSSAYFSGEALDYVRYVWIEINLMLVALLTCVLAIVFAVWCKPSPSPEGKTEKKT